MAHNPALGHDEYELTTCPECGQPVMTNGLERRLVNGTRHVCGGMGEPLVRSGFAGLPAMGQRATATLRKSFSTLPRVEER